MREQCEGCLGYTDGPLTEVCPTCVDKAAMYDVIKQELDGYKPAPKKKAENENSN